jgi:hypothetical protein
MPKYYSNFIQVRPRTNNKLKLKKEDKK